MILEGLPGVGKSTMANDLVLEGARRGVRIGLVPEVISLPSRPKRSDFVRNDQLKAENVRRFSREGYEYVVQDRSWVSTSAYSAALSGTPPTTSRESPPVSSVMTVWCFCSLGADLRRRHVGRLEEAWDDDGFAQRWTDEARQLMKRQDGLYAELRLDDEGFAGRTKRAWRLLVAS